MAGVTFTQFVLPNGQPVPFTFEVPDEVAAKAAEITSRGLSLKFEILATQDVSLTVTDPEVGDMACELVLSVPDTDGSRVPQLQPVLEAVRRLIMDFKL